MFFDGKLGSGRNVSLGGKKAKTESTKQLLEETRKQREEREILKKRTKATAVISNLIQKVILKTRLYGNLRNEFDSISSRSGMSGVKLVSWKIQLLCIFFNPHKDIFRMEQLLSSLLESLNDGKENYLSQCVWNVYKDGHSYRFVRFLNLCLAHIQKISTTSSLSRHEFFIDTIRYILERSIITIKSQEAFLWNASFSSTLLVNILRMCLSLQSFESELSASACHLQNTFIKLIQYVFADASSITNVELKCAFKHIQMKSSSDLCIWFLPHANFRLPTSKAILEAAADNFQWNLLVELVQASNSGISPIGKTIFNIESKLSLISLYAYSFRKHKLDMKKNKRFLVFWIIATSDLFSSIHTEFVSSSVNSNCMPISNILRSWEYGSHYCWNTSNIGDEVVEIQDPHGRVVKQKQISNYCRDMLLKDYELAQNEKKFDFFSTVLQFQLQNLEKETLFSGGMHGNNCSNKLQYYVERLDDTLCLLSDRQCLSEFFQWNNSLSNDNSLEISNFDKERYSAAVFSLYSCLISFFTIEYKSNESMNAGFKYSNKKAEIMNSLARSKLDAPDMKSSVPFPVYLWRYLNNKYVSLLPLWLQVEKSTFLASSYVANYCSRINYSALPLHNDILNGVHLFSQCLCYYLKGIDDDEFFNTGQLFTLSEIQQVITFLKSVMYKVYWLESPLFDINKSFLQFEDIDQFCATLKRSNIDVTAPIYGSKPIIEPEKIRIEVNSQLERGSIVLSKIYQLTINLSCVASCTQLFNNLYIRYERRPFSLTGNSVDSQTITRKQIIEAWVIPLPLSIKDYSPASVTENDVNVFAIKNSQLKMFLAFIPQVLPFRDRVRLFHDLVDQDRQNYVSSSFLPFNSLRLSVRRNHLLEDSLNQISPQPRIHIQPASSAVNEDDGNMDIEVDERVEDIRNSNNSQENVDHRSRRATTNVNVALKNRIQIEFISEQGLQEAGIDGGGLFKEFMDALSKDMVSEKYALFQITEEQLIIPNPAATSHRDFEMFEFLGKMLGKALYEKLLFQVDFAPGFLNLILGRSNQLDDLYRLDRSLYKSLMTVKSLLYKGENVSELGLYFQTTRVTKDHRPVMEDIIPNGGATEVTNDNAIYFVHHLAYYKQNIMIHAQVMSFLKGLQSIIPISWIRMFNIQELQTLLSGDSENPIDIVDMKLHTTYGSGYHPDQEYMKWFWEIVGCMSRGDQQNLLKFITSCSKQPLLGFQQLSPKLCIQKVSPYSSIPLGSDLLLLENPPGVTEAPRLPSAATCMNLLKLPFYPTKQMLREKLLYAIRSNSGFELS